MNHIYFIQVILCANSRPALNDVTYNELTVLTKRVAAISEEISGALSQGRLLIMESGQGSPCLDLRYVCAIDNLRIFFFLNIEFCVSFLSHVALRVPICRSTTSKLR